MTKSLNTPLPQSYVDSMPCDTGILLELGRVNWAAARLHFTVRDALNSLNNRPSNEPFNQTLGKALRTLKNRALNKNHPEIAEWVDSYGSPANKHRNSVVHAITYTAEDGKQALMTTERYGSKRLQNPELREITRFLMEAAACFPASFLGSNE
ncbi:hypothetical protein ACN4DJ_02605 [Corynebacterium macclintockiae]|uniref:hypothetical protein n=1 Tax=Corynebacterium macclintockiae TaxID=2913501 RepID=UPI003EBD3CC4